MAIFTSVFTDFTEESFFYVPYSATLVDVTTGNYNFFTWVIKLQLKFLLPWKKGKMAIREQIAVYALVTVQNVCQFY